MKTRVALTAAPLLASCLASLWLSACHRPQASLEATSISIPLEKRADGLAYPLGGTLPFSGESITFTKNLKRQAVELYQDGRPQGTWTRYWSSGQLKREERWERGSLVHRRQWFETGTLKEDAELRDGIGFGKVRLWWPDGRLRRISWLGENARPHGHVLEYAEDGTILTDAIFHHGTYLSGTVRPRPPAPDPADD